MTEVDDPRLLAFTDWLMTRPLEAGTRFYADKPFRPVSDDASFRRYFRRDDAPGLVFVDAPPTHEDNPSFIKVSAALAAAGLHCPVVLASHLEGGFLILTDLGDDIYLNSIVDADGNYRDELYRLARETILRMQTVSCELPVYDSARLMDEMSLFHDWFLTRQLGLTLTPEDESVLADTHKLLIGSALAQPVRFVHRDYHARNLMVCGDRTPGILDFQDAIMGPITYDLVSLYKDCYYRFERHEVKQAVAAFHTDLVAAGTASTGDPVLEWFDLMGMQRHLKCAGIFSRLNLRDGKPRYLGDIPLVIDYLTETAGNYSSLRAFAEWMSIRVLPEARRQELAR